MKSLNSFLHRPSLYATAWQYVGPGILVALMFVIVASAATLREQAGIAGGNAHDRLVLNRGPGNLNPRQNPLIGHSVRLELPVEHLRASDGRLTPHGESLFSFLARRMKSRSLTIMLSAHSIDDAKFATTIAAHMMGEVPLEATQLRISSDALRTARDTPGNAVLSVTITRHETVDGEAE